MRDEQWDVVTSDAELVELVGEPLPRVADKARTTLHALDRQWLAASPFCLVATSAADGSCDVSPKGDPAGFVHVVDDSTIAVPERRGNRRADGFRNILSNPHVGLLSVIPGRGDTLRVNGRGRLVRDAPFFDAMVVKRHRPSIALVIEVDEVYHHCAKAFLRSNLWSPHTWEPEAMVGRAVIAKTLDRPDDTIEELQRYYGPAYAEHLY